MGRWLLAAREAEKKSKTLKAGTDITNETPPGEVLSVLSVRETCESKKIPSTHPVGGQGVSSVLSVTRMGISENSSVEETPLGLSAHRCQCGALGIIAEGWFLKTPEKARWFCGACYRERS